MANKALNKTPKFETAKPPVRKPGEAGFIEWCNMVVSVSFDAYEKIEKERVTASQARTKLKQARSALMSAAQAAKRRGAEGE
jgi:hypothetical protein